MQALNIFWRDDGWDGPFIDRLGQLSQRSAIEAGGSWIVEQCGDQFLAGGFMALQVKAGVYDGPELGFIVGFVTFTPAFIATVISLILVGPKHCKLAWISLCVYPATFVMAILAAIIDGALK